MQVMPWLFLVKVNKEQQKSNREKVSQKSPFFMPISSVHNSRNMEHGEIVQIGELVQAVYGWENCKVGDVLIFHHLIETDADKSGKSYFVFEDETFNYYVVDDVNTRGFYNGITVTPHPDYVFLKNIPPFTNSDAVDEHTGNKIKKEGSLFLLTDWRETPLDIKNQSVKIQNQIDSLIKSTRTPEIQTVLESLEAQKIALNRKAQQKKYLPYRVAYSNRKVDRNFGRKVLADDLLMCFNKGCLYISNFQLEEYTYIICRVEDVGVLINNEV